jgi:hypothetical protein
VWILVFVHTILNLKTLMSCVTILTPNNMKLANQNKWKYAHTYEFAKTFLEDCSALWHCHLQLPTTQKKNINSPNGTTHKFGFLVSFGIGFLCVCKWNTFSSLTVKLQNTNKWIILMLRRCPIFKVKNQRFKFKLLWSWLEVTLFVATSTRIG